MNMLLAALGLLLAWAFLEIRAERWNGRRWERHARDLGREVAARERELLECGENCRDARYEAFAANARMDELAPRIAKLYVLEVNYKLEKKKAENLAIQLEASRAVNAGLASELRDVRKRTL